MNQKLEWYVNLGTRDGFLEFLKGSTTTKGQLYARRFEAVIETEEDFKEFWKYFNADFNNLYLALDMVRKKKFENHLFKSFASFVYAYKLDKRKALQSLFLEYIRNIDVEQLDRYIEQGKLDLETLYHKALECQGKKAFWVIVKEDCMVHK